MLNIDVSNLNSTGLKEILIRHGISSGLAERIRKISELYYFVEYSSVAAAGENHENILGETGEILSALKDALSEK